MLESEQTKAKVKKVVLAYSGGLDTSVIVPLVGRGVPFREAHTITGGVVRLAAIRGISLDRLSQEDLQSLHPSFAEDVRQVFDPQSSVAQRDVAGGTAPSAVSRQLAEAKRL